ncbi:MAG: glycosyltransferase family 2 protein [Lachnospiraceae bacterium]|nr:glycosyltransferase family 2 protein [Lachnospiraceae bacterium]MCI9471231.1 glycosyltransferase family 2 protein [Lachnospiraceae bacterium]
MKDPILSIFMPVYNAGRFLRSGLDSILCQSFQDFELFIYNDGSIDDSLSICQEYQSRDGRIFLESGENGKHIYKMNEFIQKANGKYIGFVDADDRLDVHYFEDLVMLLDKTEADCVVSSYICIDVDGKELGWKTPSLKDGEILSGREALIRFLTTKDIEGFRWNKIYKKDAFIKSEMKFENQFPEDIIGEAILLSFVKKVVLSKSKGYYYRQSSASKVATVSFEKTKGFLDTFKSVSELAKCYGLQAEAEYYIVWRTINILYEAIKNKKKYNQDDWNMLISECGVRSWLGMPYISILKILYQKYEEIIGRTKTILKALIVFVYVNKNHRVFNKY